MREGDGGRLRRQCEKKSEGWSVRGGVWEGEWGKESMGNIEGKEWGELKRKQTFGSKAERDEREGMKGRR